MREHVTTIGRLLTGTYTPFHEPPWGADALAVIQKWREGDVDAGAVRRLEEAIAASWGAGWTVRTAHTGRAALQLALEALDLPAGSDVIVPTFACGAVAVAVLQAGHRPVFVDCTERWTIRFESILEADAPSVRAVVVIHVAGGWAEDLARIRSWADARGVCVIEDCAQAVGLEAGGVRAGETGDIAVFSSGYGKALCGIGGGWAMSRKSALAAALRNRRIPDREPTRAERERRVHIVTMADVAARRRQGRVLLRDAVAAKAARFLLASCTMRMRPACEAFSLYAIDGAEAYVALLELRQVSVSAPVRSANAEHWRALLSLKDFSGVHLAPVQPCVPTTVIVSRPGATDARAMRAMRQAWWSHGVETEPAYTPLHLRPQFRALRCTAMPVIDRQWQGAYTVSVRPTLSAEDWSRIARGAADAARAFQRFV